MPVTESATTGAPRLRVVLCTCDGAFGTLVLERLLVCARLRVTGVVRSTRVLSPRFGFWRGALGQIRRSGLTYAAYLLAATKIADTLCRLEQRPCVARLAAARAIPTLQTRDVNDVVGHAFVARRNPQLLVSAFFNQRFSPALLSLPSLGCVNIHPSLLPQFRGTDPVFQAQLRQAPIGVTLHLMSSSLDEGNVLAQDPVAVPSDASTFAATAELFRRGVELLLARLEAIERGDPGTAQRGTASYHSWPTRAQVRQFHARGGVLLRLADLAQCLRRHPPRREALRWRAPNQDEVRAKSGYRCDAGIASLQSKRAQSLVEHRHGRARHRPR